MQQRRISMHVLQTLHLACPEKKRQNPNFAKYVLTWENEVLEIGISAPLQYWEFSMFSQKEKMWVYFPYSCGGSPTSLTFVVTSTFSYHNLLRGVAHRARKGVASKITSHPASWAPCAGAPPVFALNSISSRLSLRQPTTAHQYEYPH